jgi:release factor glutamine methyltransferase
VSLAALRISAANAKGVQVKALHLAGAELFTAFRSGPRFDVICSNPPYVPTAVIPTLAPEVRDFEPLIALDGGPDGLDVIREIIAQAGDFLAPGGSLCLEIGDGQDAAVVELMTSKGFEDVSAFPDLAGKPRVVRGKAK